MKNLTEKIITFDNYDNILSRFLLGDYVIIKSKCSNYFLTVKFGNNYVKPYVKVIDKSYQFVFPDINEITMEYSDINYIVYNHRCVRITEHQIPLDLFLKKYANYKRTNNYKRQIGSING